MKLTIVIVHFNTSGDLVRCLESLVVSPPSCEMHIVVVDNASVDPGFAAAQERFPEVQWVLNRENVGYARGANQGMTAAPADYYLILNPDVVAEPDAIDALLSFADQHPKAGIIGPQLLNEDGTIQDSCRRFYTFKTLLLRRTFFGKLFPRSRTLDEHLMRDFDHRMSRPVDWVLGGCLLVRHQAIDLTGPMDERFFLYFEDVDWCYRMWQAGWEVLYSPAGRFVHRHRRDSAKGALSKSFWLHLGSLISFYEKWGMLVYLLKKWRGPLVVFLRWAMDMSALTLAFLTAYALRWLANPLFAQPLFPLGEYRSLWWFGIMLATVTFLLAGRYRRRGHRSTLPTVANFQQVATVSLLLLASTYLGRQEAISRAVLLLFIPFFALFTALGADLFGLLRRRLEHGYFSLERTLLVGEPDVLSRWRRNHGDLRRMGIDPVGYLATPAAPGETLPPLDQRELPWLGGWPDLAEVVRKYRISQVVFWSTPGLRSDEMGLLAKLHRQRIRLRWRSDDLWLLAAGARAEPFAGQLSGVLEPVTGSVWRSLLWRLLDVSVGLLLLVTAAVPYLWLRWTRLPAGRAAVRDIECRDPWGEDASLRLACRAGGEIMPLWWQWPLAGSLLTGRVAVVGPRLSARQDRSPAPSGTQTAGLWRQGWRRPGLTGPWGAGVAQARSRPSDPHGSGEPPAGPPTFSFAGSWTILKGLGRQLLFYPTGLVRVPRGETPESAADDESRPSREVP